jgi:hypothetical protein
VAQRAVADVVQDHVVAGGRAGEILGRVVDHAGGAERAHQVQVAGAAHAGDRRTQRGGDLHGVAADAAGGAVDQNLLPGLYLADVPDAAQRGRGRHRQRRGLLEAQAVRHGHDQVSPGAGVFGEGARAETQDVLAGAQAGYADPGRFHPAGRVDPGDPGLGPGQSRSAHEPRDVGVAAQHVPVVGVERGGVHPDQHLAGTNPRRVDAGQPQLVRWSEPVLDDRFHGSPSVPSWPAPMGRGWLARVEESR